MGDFGAVLSPAKRWERLVLGPELTFCCCSVMVEMLDGGAMLRRLV